MPFGWELSKDLILDDNCNLYLTRIVYTEGVRTARHNCGYEMYVFKACEHFFIILLNLARWTIQHIQFKTMDYEGYANESIEYKV